MEADQVLDGLDPEQLAVARAVRGPVCVLAGAGTGKTRAITHRIAYAVASGVVPETGVLAVTFTARAAAEMRTRLRALGAPRVQARTFHAAALRQLGFFWPKIVGGPLPRLVESKVRLVADAARTSGLALGRTELRDLASEIEWAKATQTRPEDYENAAAKAGRAAPLGPREVARVFEAYEELRREHNLLDFEAMLELTAAVLTEHADVAAQVREQYRYFVVDEYQDVSPLQQLLLDTWLGERDDLCVVGDPNQTIYSFTGATPGYLTGFSVRHPDAAVIRLVRDYRSTPQVVRLANGVIGQARGAAARHRLELVAQRPDGPEPGFTAYDDEVAEASAVAAKAAALIESGVPAREIAVLFRVNAQSEPYEQAFTDAGVPYVMRGADRFFDRAEVRQAIHLLQGARRADDDAAMVVAVRHILAGIGLSPEPPGGGSARARWESLAALAQLAEDVAAEHPGATMADFVEELRARAAAQHAPELEGATLASLHAAKGLEWDAVFLVGLTEGMMPIVYADTAEQVEEERRLLYVGVTRAREHLALSWSLARSPGGRKNRRPSRFLDGLRPASPSLAAERPPRRAFSGPQPCRVCGQPLTAAAERKLGRCADCPADYDEALLDRLREWRAAESREQKVPAYVVFTDATLQAIAERAPSSAAELGAIPGVGAVKLNRYGAAVLGLCGADPAGD
ncbi:ATP-dependent helicase [Allonocardiopsis opalescens]|uniref:DNA 3'-5' helicase n=1 Tax=Allonocardiopsis opalescens TaxID=1144618 RepID=A0A2T0QDP0_9ACTN|nr:ATP-dependent DNA helicase UvrD2 [Allonocardiopsis opalescens]PRY02018.1 Rep family ATP-dependent DNA helicase [Allonocardiopsis opalescens]